MNNLIMQQLLAANLPSGGQYFLEGPVSTTNVPTTASFVVPAGVTTISILCVSGGDGGAVAFQSDTSGFPPSGGAGGSLSYSNNIAVTPGETLTVQAGHPGRGGASNGVSTPGGSGGDSKVSRGATVLVAATRSAGSQVGAAKFRGGNGGAGFDASSNPGAGGGGGAAGYSGNGGNGGAPGQTGQAGTGGGGGGGNGGPVNAVGFGGNGGGVGAFGEGVSGAAGGGNGSVISGGVAYGGGGGGALYASGSGSAGNGVRGFVRIIWPGDLRQFPSTRTLDE